MHRCCRVAPDCILVCPVCKSLFAAILVKTWHTSVFYRSCRTVEACPFVDLVEAFVSQIWSWSKPQPCLNSACTLYHISYHIPYIKIKVLPSDTDYLALSRARNTEQCGLTYYRRGARKSCKSHVETGCEIPTLLHSRLVPASPFLRLSVLYPTGLLPSTNHELKTSQSVPSKTIFHN